MKLDFSRYIFEKYSNSKRHENPSGGSGVIPMRTDGRIARQKNRHDDANNCFLKFCE